MHEREGLIARIRHLRRVAAAPDPPARRAAPAQSELQALESRVAHLEQLLQGLQDSVHREAKRTSKRIDDLEAQIQPAAVAKALSQDARDRGL